MFANSYQLVSRKPAAIAKAAVKQARSTAVWLAEIQFIRLPELVSLCKSDTPILILLLPLLQLLEPPPPLLLVNMAVDIQLLGALAPPPAPDVKLTLGPQSTTISQIHHTTS